MEAIASPTTFIIDRINNTKEDLSSLAEIARQWEEVAQVKEEESRSKGLDIALFNSASNIAYTIRTTIKVRLLCGLYDDSESLDQGVFFVCRQKKGGEILGIALFSTGVGYLRTIVSNPICLNHPLNTVTRIHGIGTAIIHKLAQICVEIDAPLMVDIKENALLFYKKLGFVQHQESSKLMLRLDLNKCKSITQYK